MIGFFIVLKSGVKKNCAKALGGFGSINGSLIAGVIIGIVESVGGLLIDPSYKLLYVFAVYLLVVILRPQGIFGRY